MSTGGLVPRWRASHLAALGLAASLAVAACGGNDDTALQDRVDELEQENQELRARIDDLQAAAATTTLLAPAPTSAPNAPALPSAPTPTTVATPTSATAILGTRENPIPLGEPVVSGDWTFTVEAFEPNVSDFVAQMDANNDPAGDGKVYSRLRLRAVYGGREGAGDPGRLQISLVTPTGQAVGSVEPCCEPARDSLTDQAPTFPGGTVEGWTYYDVTAADLFAGPFSAFDVRGDSDRTPDGLLFFRVT